MELAQFIHLGAIVTGIVIALCARWFALLFAAPFVVMMSGTALWFHGYSALTALGSAIIDVVLLQFAFFLTFFVLSRVSVKRQHPTTGAEHSVIDPNKLPVF